ncbi:hypothetical protein B0H11DRAFT_2297889, partial [Mycena galericulata]
MHGFNASDSHQLDPSLLSLSILPSPLPTISPRRLVSPFCPDSEYNGHLDPLCRLVQRHQRPKRLHDAETPPAHARPRPRSFPPRAHAPRTPQVPPDVHPLPRLGPRRRACVDIIIPPRLPRTRVVRPLPPSRPQRRRLGLVLVRRRGRPPAPAPPPRAHLARRHAQARAPALRHPQPPHAPAHAPPESQTHERRRLRPDHAHVRRPPLRGPHRAHHLPAPRLPPPALAIGCRPARFCVAAQRSPRRPRRPPRRAPARPPQPPPHPIPCAFAPSLLLSPARPSDPRAPPVRRRVALVFRERRVPTRRVRCPQRTAAPAHSPPPPRHIRPRHARPSRALRQRLQRAWQHEHGAHAHARPRRELDAPAPRPRPRARGPRPGAGARGRRCWCWCPADEYQYQYGWSELELEFPLFAVVVAVAVATPERLDGWRE